MMTPREIEVMETIGARVRTGVKPVIVTEAPPKWGRVILPLAFLVICLVTVFVHAAKHEVSEDVPGPVWLESGR